VNINFDQIITLANKRKDQLMLIQGLLNTMQPHIEALDAAHAHFHRLELACKGLDIEGRAMLGEVHRQAWAVAERLETQLRYMLTGRSGAHEVDYSFPRLRAAMDATNPQEN
jgi:hypothetical protein